MDSGEFPWSPWTLEDLYNKKQMKTNSCGLRGFHELIKTLVYNKLDISPTLYGLHGQYSVQK